MNKLVNGLAKSSDSVVKAALDKYVIVSVYFN